jgi:hypothetical protein
VPDHEAAARRDADQGAGARVAVAANAEGVYATVSEIGDAENISKSYIRRILRLTLLAPDIVDAILAGRTDQGGDARAARATSAGELGGATWLARPPDASVGITTAIRVRDLPTRKTPAGALALFDRRERAGLSAGWSKIPRVTQGDTGPQRFIPLLGRVYQARTAHLHTEE